MQDLVVPNINQWGKEIDFFTWKLLKLKLEDKVIFDMKDMEFIKPSGAIFLVLFCKYTYEITKSKVELINIKAQIHSYLERIDFFQMVEEWAFTKQKLAWWQEYNINKNSVNVIEISLLREVTDIYQFSEKCQKVLESWCKGPLDKEYRNQAMRVVSEACANAFDHSGSDAFIMLQRYASEYGENKINIALGDMGIGIRDHLRKVHSWVGSHDTDFIEQALNGLSGRSDTEGGLGLKAIQKVTSEHDGKIVLRSGKGMVTVNRTRYQRQEFNYRFPGTQYLIIL